MLYEHQISSMLIHSLRGERCELPVPNAISALLPEHFGYVALVVEKSGIHFPHMVFARNVRNSGMIRNVRAARTGHRTMIGIEMIRHRDSFR